MNEHCSGSATECGFNFFFNSTCFYNVHLFPVVLVGFGFSGVHYNQALTMRSLPGVSTVHESWPLMHQAISMVLRLWGFARK